MRGIFEESRRKEQKAYEKAARGKTQEPGLLVKRIWARLAVFQGISMSCNSDGEKRKIPLSKGTSLRSR